MIWLRPCSVARVTLASEPFLAFCSVPTANQVGVFDPVGSLLLRAAPFAFIWLYVLEGGPQPDGLFQLYDTRVTLPAAVLSLY